MDNEPSDHSKHSKSVLTSDVTKTFIADKSRPSLKNKETTQIKFTMSDFPPQNNNSANASGQNPQERYKLTMQYVPTKEEERVLSECSIEATINRALPIGMLFGLGAFKLVKAGYLQVIRIMSHWASV